MRALLVSQCVVAIACGGTALPTFDAGTSDAGARADGGGLDAGTHDAGIADAGTSDAGIGADGGATVDGGRAMWDPATTPEAAARFPLGVQSGDVTSASAILWTRYTGTDALRLRVVEATSSAPYPIVLDLAATPAAGGFTKIEVGSLRPATTYRFAFVEDAGARGRSALGRFVTAPFANERVKVRFGATSCTDQDYKPFPTLSRAAGENLDFFLLLGDTSYNDPAHTREEYRARWAENLGSRGYLDLLASTSHIATWDDHEVVDNWDGETVDSGRLATAREAFFETLALARRPPPNENRIWRSFRYGRAVEVFVLDCRGERLPSTRQTPRAQYISAEQLAWLKSGLSASTAAFKIIANSVPIANFPSVFDLLANDRWEGYEAQREDILDYITANDLKGVVWLSGDFHVAAVVKVEPSGPRAAYYDILAGPGGQSGNPVTPVLTGSQFELATTTNNVVIFDADATVEPPTLRFRFVDGQGGVFFDKTLTP
jgi:phosphodiesterase/alkaline phosphatase D-like protein